ncbi:SDR family NAD(P)-dependent oxidoreductase [Pseudonocardia nematodicida]|uniref:SDR family NAD(P)-dependent oxidoreductase n=1 Tax=Pseudonocardia nematodicida TaxID=1206997 RepID=A0ABV1KID4_9PSEU
MTITDRTILITGAGTGMGLEAARRFSELGNRVLMVARNAERLRNEAEKLPGAVALPCDISDEAAVTDLVERVRADHPELSMIFLNAGITTGHPLFAAEDPLEAARAEMETNYFATIRLTHALFPVLVARPAATIIITTSGVAFAPDLVNPTYSATKAALHSYTQSIRLQMQRQGTGHVRVVELMAPLVDAPFSSNVHSAQKVSPASVITALIDGLAGDQDELHVGVVSDIFDALRRSSADALAAVNGVTAG